jgi:16S rRNA (guanine527-N7)-methyltransferase
MFDLLKLSLQNLKIDISDNLILKLLHFWNFLLENNSKINLISRKITYYSIINHLTDSLTPLLFNLSSNLNIMDIGSGGGFPAIPLKIVKPSWRFTLVESKLNKSIFLNDLCYLLNLSNISILNFTLTKNIDYLKNQFDLITIRGLASLNILLPLIFPYLKNGGFFISFKGPNYMNEIDLSKKILSKKNIILIDVKSIILPFVNLNRHLLLFKKIV